MPELPDIAAYISALEPRIVAQPIEQVRLASPFLLRTAQPPLTNVEGRIVRELRRIGKRIAIGVEGDLWLVLHLMIAGRLHWRAARSKAGRTPESGSFRFSQRLSRAHRSRHKASRIAVCPRVARRRCSPSTLAESTSSPAISTRFAPRSPPKTARSSGLSPIRASSAASATRIRTKSCTPPNCRPSRSPKSLNPDEWERLFTATRDTLKLWMDRLRAEAEADFPEKVTAFRKDMAVHGRYGEPCPRCGEKIQRIRYADNETNYCARCQTGGKLLADRSLSRLLRADWPRTLEELEALKRR